MVVALLGEDNLPAALPNVIAVEEPKVRLLQDPDNLFRGKSLPVRRALLAGTVS